MRKTCVYNNILIACLSLYYHITCNTFHLPSSIHIQRITEHNARITAHTSHITHHISHITYHITHITHHISHITSPTSHLTHHISHITHITETSHLTYHIFTLVCYRFTHPWINCATHFSTANYSCIIIFSFHW